MLLLLLLVEPGSTSVVENRFTLESGPGRAGALSWQSATLALSAPDESKGAGSWQLDVAQLALANPLGSISINCVSGGFRQGRPWCAQGRFEWRWADDREPLRARLGEPGEAAGMAFEFENLGLSGRLQWPAEAEHPLATLQLARLDLAALPASLLDVLGLSVLEGYLSGEAEFSTGSLSFDLDLDEGAFDRPDGLVAGGGLSLSLSGRIDGVAGDEGMDFSLALAQRAGELLAGPVYLPPPDKPLELDLAGVLRPGTSLVVDSLLFKDGGLVEASGGLVLQSEEGRWHPVELTLERARLQFPGAWRRWGEGPAAARGFGDLETEGEVVGSMVWRSGRLESLDLALDGVSVNDPSGRFAIDSIDGGFARSPEQFRAELDWDGLDLFNLPFGGSKLLAAGAPDNWRLTKPVHLPLLSGAVVIEQLEVGLDEAGESAVVLDAGIEPLELSELTRVLGFPVFGGELSGRFPGVRVSGDRITFAGGIGVQAFSGDIRLSELVIERPFGSLPALAAQVEIDRLDLAELTGAFNFGHMEGELSGWMRGLRLLDWRPVAMDARLFTHEDAPSRRISQRAVANLSRLGGGAAAIGATVLRIFEEFPYRRAGLACRLDRNICHLDGVAPHESGGFYIVEGRGLPHLDVVGHRRLVDWPRLVAQLVAATQG